MDEFLPSARFPSSASGHTPVSGRKSLAVPAKSLKKGLATAKNITLHCGFPVMKLSAFFSSLAPSSATAPVSRWSEERAQEWYARQPWLIGSNYNPANAMNQLEMWQAETFDPQRIDQELGWTQELGMNTMRVFLHDLLWIQDPIGLLGRMETFLEIAEARNIKPLFVLFDSCWDPNPQLGPQRPPTPGIHNSGWVQGPGAAALKDKAQYPRLEEYVKGVVGHFAKDERILGWDVWNEPDNLNTASYAKREPKNKLKLVQKLLPQVFRWTRDANPTQPLTSGIWMGDWSSHAKLSPIERIQIESSDFVTFHNYEGPEEFEKRIKYLQRYNRPLICTEYMARGLKSTFHGKLPVAQRHNVGMMNWGFVAGKSQTNLPWDSWQKPYVNHEPSVWFHEIFHTDGTPYRQEEVELIKQMTGVLVPEKAVAV